MAKNDPGEMQSDRDSTRRDSSLSTALMVLAVVAACVGAAYHLIELQSQPRVWTDTNKCVNQMRQIGIALHAYHETFGSFPPAFVADDEGRPQHSWRVLILPYVEAHELYQQYRFDEPWNGPNNRKLVDKMPAAYRCPAAEFSLRETNYVAVIGSQTAWPGAVGSRLSDFTDSPGETILLIETVDSGINWMEPRDLTFAEATRGINLPSPTTCPSSKHPEGINVCFADFHAQRPLSKRMTPDVFRALLTISGGEAIDRRILE